MMKTLTICILIFVIIQVESYYLTTKRFDGFMVEQSEPRILSRFQPNIKVAEVQEISNLIGTLNGILTDLGETPVTRRLFGGRLVRLQ